MVALGDGDQGASVFGGDAVLGGQRHEGIGPAVHEDDGLLQPRSALQTAGSWVRWAVISLIEFLRSRGSTP